MEVVYEKEQKDVYVGDIILFNRRPCMVVYLGSHMDKYGVVSLDGGEGGVLLATFDGLCDIDGDSRTESVLIEQYDVVITKKEGAGVCLF